MRRSIAGGAAYFADLVAVWQRAVYAQSGSAQADCRLCRGFAASLEGAARMNANLDR